MEGPGRYTSAVEGVGELNQWVDSLLVIDNERLRALYGKLPLKEAFGKADDVLGMATKGIAELITVEYALVRVDFADVETVMRGSGRAHMSVVSASGDSRALQVAEGALRPEDITTEFISDNLYSSEYPDPDLIIRTGGEYRLSNFLMWQAAYSELYFTPTLWPDFDKESFREALQAYSGRKRRFGLVEPQNNSTEK
jgi:hypothetical protein